ncbi:MAG: hypothetical protein ABJF50_16415 [Paracoccaceae bacterium]
MSNVVAFKKVETETPEAATPKSMTLFIHIKRTTLIAHCGDLKPQRTATQDRVGKGY